MRFECVCVLEMIQKYLSLASFCSITNSSDMIERNWRRLSQILDRSPNLFWMHVTPSFSRFNPVTWFSSPPPFFLISKSGTYSRGWEKGGDYYLSADAVGPFCTLRVGEKPRLNLGSGFRCCEKRNWKKLTLGRPSDPPLLRSYPHRSRRLKHYKNRVIDAPCLFLLSLSLSLFIIRCVVFFFD